MNREELENAIESIDWEKLHRLYALNEYGMKIFLYPDGEMTIHTSNTIPAPGNTCFHIIHCIGGNISEEYYSGGWAEWDTELGEYIDSETGEHIDTDTMIERCIQDGDHTLLYEEWKDEIWRQWEDEVSE